MRKICFLFLVCAAFTSGALSSQAGEQRRYRSSAKEFNRRDPVAEATENFRKREIYIFSAMGVGQYFPGLKDDRLAMRIAKKYGERPLGGTSDFIESDAHLHYVQAATKFASAYNLQIVKLLQEKRRRWPWQRN